MQEADRKQIRRLRSLVTQMKNLEEELRIQGDREVADLLRNSRRELEYGERLGIFHVRGEDMGDVLPS